MFALLSLRHVNKLTKKWVCNKNTFQSHSFHDLSPYRWLLYQVTKKAIVTTIMILGSTIFGWLPPFVSFTLFCDDCPLSDVWGRWKTNYTLFTAVNTAIQFLLIIKPATNFYIYAFRMKEIRVSSYNLNHHFIIYLLIYFFILSSFLKKILSRDFMVVYFRDRKYPPMFTHPWTRFERFIVQIS